MHIEEPPVLHSDLWWALKILKQASFVPDEVRWRTQIDELRVRSHEARDDGLAAAEGRRGEA